LGTIESTFARTKDIRKYHIDDVRIEMLPTSRAAATFHKTWETLQRDGKIFSGEKIEKLTFSNSPEGWKIVREEELNIIRATKGTTAAGAVSGQNAASPSSPPSSNGAVETGAEVAILRSGLSIRHEHRQVMGNTTRLYVTKDGSSFVDVPTAEINGFEKAIVSPPPPFADLDQAVMAASSTYRLDPDLLSIVLNAGTESNMPPVSPQKAAQHLRELLERYNFDIVKALAAYKVGPERVEQISGLPPEASMYVAGILKDYNKRKTKEEAHVNKN